MENIEVFHRGFYEENVACASPYIACLFENSPMDPQLKTIIRSLLFWRRFFAKFPGTRFDFCNRLSSDKKEHGPASNLKKSLQAIGWTALGQGWITHNSGVALNWVEASKSFLRKIVRQCWNFHVAERSRHRKDFDLESIDEFNIKNIMKNKNCRDKAILVAHCTGAAYTKSAFAKYDHSVDPNCPFCGTKDTREHRLFSCKNLQSTRKNKAKLMKWLSKRSVAARNLAMMPICEVNFLVLHRFQKPWPEWTLPIESSNCEYVFCDGSAYMQDQPTCTLAGSAVIRAEPNSDSYDVLAAQPLPGIDHSSYRGEAFAIFLALQCISRPIVFSDCQAVVTQLEELLDAHNNGRYPSITDHNDIWDKIWHHVKARPKGWIQIVKTKAHCNLSDLHDEQLVWEAKANNFVDILAKKAVSGWSEVFPAMQKRYKAIILEKTMTMQLCDLVLEQAHVSLDRSKNEPEESTTDSLGEIFTNRKPNPLLCEPFRLEIPQIPCKFGDEFLSRVVSWAGMLEWPSVSTGHISLLELYIDFTLFTKSLCPVPIGGSKGTKVQKYLLKDKSNIASTIVQPLAQQNVIWVRFLRWAETNGCTLWPHPILQRSNCLMDIVYSLWTPALGTHPKLVMGDKTYKVLKSLFQTSSGKRRNLNIAYSGDVSSLLQPSETLCVLPVDSPSWFV